MVTFDLDADDDMLVESPPQIAIPMGYQPPSDGQTTPASPKTGEGVRGAAPWEGAQVATSIHVDVVRERLREELNLELQHATGGDRTFLVRLMHVLESPNLDLPPFPDVAQELNEMLKDENTSVVQLAGVIERDPGLVKRVWAQGSSARYMNPPRSLHHAVSRIGLDALWQLGMAVCMDDNVFRLDGFQDKADAARTQGVVAAEVAAWISKEPRGPMYMAGLLHAVGKLILYRTASDGTDKKNPPSVDLVDRLAKKYYPSFGVLVARSWKLDNLVVGGVGFHSAPDAADPEVEHCARVLHAAVLATHTASQERAGIDGDGFASLQKIEGLKFDIEGAIAKAYEVFEN